MIYLSEFRLPTQEREERALSSSGRNKLTVYSSRYPFMLFWGRSIPRLEFEPVTLLYGGNGSGKSTVLNIIAEKLRLPRETPYNRSDFFDDYIELCDYTLDSEIPDESSIITSDDVFDRVLDIRRLNLGVDRRRESLIREFVEERGNEEPNRLTGLDDFNDWKRRSLMRNRNTTRSEFLRRSMMRNLTERSNGESALSYFVDKIADGGLYLLDEPENSLSPANQLKLRDFIAESARSFGCQFIISTHSPFLLSLRRAKIYDLDALPIRTAESWSELESVRVYFDFFEENRAFFEK